jgi:methylase of polypeptide subunit release factors
VTTTRSAQPPAPRVSELRFGSLSIAYDERVLRPRSWTLRQALWGAELLVAAPAGPVLELCCGAGQIGLHTVASSQRELVAVDVDEAACELTRRNAATAGLTDRVEVRHGDLGAAVAPDERFALILADPPYLRCDETGRYPEDPLLAIDGGPDGMHLVWRCLDVIAQHLLPGADALLQLRSAEQAGRVADRLAADGDLVLHQYRSFGHGVVARICRT